MIFFFLNSIIFNTSGVEERFPRLVFQIENVFPKNSYKDAYIEIQTQRFPTMMPRVRSKAETARRKWLFFKGVPLIKMVF